MPIGDCQSLMLPSRKTLADRLEARLFEIGARVAFSEKLTKRNVSQRLPSGRETVLVDRVAWAFLGLAPTGLVKRIRRAVLQLTDEGGSLLEEKPERVDCELLRA